MERTKKLVNRDLKPNKLKDCSERDSGSVSIRLTCAVPFCDYKSNKQSNLDRHHKAMHQHPKKSRVCCGKKFLTNFEHNEHRKKHHKGGFQCKHCKKSGISRKFPRKGLLERHENTHTGRKPYGCSVCEYSCGNKSNVNRHIANKHKNDEAAYVQTVLINGKRTIVDEDATDEEPSSSSSSSSSSKDDSSSTSSTRMSKVFRHSHSIESILSRPYTKTTGDVTVHPNQNEISYPSTLSCQQSQLPELPLPPPPPPQYKMQQQSTRVPTSVPTTGSSTSSLHKDFYNNPYQIGNNECNEETTFTKQSLILPGWYNSTSSFRNYSNPTIIPHPLTLTSSRTSAEYSINCRINVIGHQYSCTSSSSNKLDKKSVLLVPSDELSSEIEQESCSDPSCSFYLHNQSAQSKVISFNSEGAFGPGILGRSKRSVERTRFRRVREKRDDDDDEPHFMNETSPVSLPVRQEVYFMNGAQTKETTSVGSPQPHVGIKTKGDQHVDMIDSQVPTGLRNNMSFVHFNSREPPLPTSKVYHPKKLRQKYINKAKIYQQD